MSAELQFTLPTPPTHCSPTTHSRVVSSTPTPMPHATAQCTSSLTAVQQSASPWLCSLAQLQQIGRGPLCALHCKSCAASTLLVGSCLACCILFCHLLCRHGLKSGLHLLLGALAALQLPLHSTEYAANLPANTHRQTRRQSAHGVAESNSSLYMPQKRVAGSSL